MLTLLNNIQRFNRRYNRRRGSAMLMVLMTMAVTMVVGTSMLFVTLSSFSTSIADTNQSKAEAATSAVSEQIQDGIASLIPSYLSSIQDKNSSTYVQFAADATSLSNKDYNDYMLVNGVKVYVMLTNEEGPTPKKLLVDIIGVKGSQSSKISFSVENSEEVSDFSISDTFGNSLVVSGSIGKEQTDPSVILRRIEGDVSINCYSIDESTGKRVMKTQVFNPIILEGVTGSIYANGDLIIGATDNMIRVQGNIYCDGNLTIRGLDVGCNLPALRKKYYQDKYINYYSYVYDDTIALGIKDPNSLTLKLINPDHEDGGVGDAMYEVGNGGLRIVNCYDKISHYTLKDLALELDKNATTYSFWTKEYKQNSDNSWSNDFEWKKVTIQLYQKDASGNILLDSEGYRIDCGADCEANGQYLGAKMYYCHDQKEETCPYAKTEGSGDPILQYPEGGNIFCSGDIIFDTVNYGNAYTYDGGVISSDVVDSWGISSTIAKKITDEISGKGKIDYKSCAGIVDYGMAPGVVSDDNVGKIPIQTIIRGDVYCQGRMVIAPDTTKVYTNYNGIDKVQITTLFDKSASSTTRYINANTYSSLSFLKSSDDFRNKITSNWKSVTGKNYDQSITLAYINSGKTTNNDSNRLFNITNMTFTLTGKTYSNLVSDYNTFKNSLTTSSTQYKDRMATLRNYLNSATSKISDYVYSGIYSNTNDGSTPDSISKGRTVKFSTSSNIYIANSSVRKDLADYNTTDPYKVVFSTTSDITTIKYIYGFDSNGNPIHTNSKSEEAQVDYTAALTIRFADIKVNNVYAKGAIQVIGSNVTGYVDSGSLTATSYITSNAIKSEYTLESIRDILYQKGLTDSQIATDYFGYNSSNNSYSGVSDITVGNSNNSTIKVGAITYDREIVILKAHLEATETVHVKNTNKKYGTTWAFDYIDSNRSYQLVIDLAYCISDKRIANNAAGCLVSGDGTNKIEFNDSIRTTYGDNIYNIVKYIKEHENTVKFSSTAFIQAITSTDANTIINNLVGHQGYFGSTSIADMGSDPAHKTDYNAWYAKWEKGYYYRTATQEIPLINITNLTSQSDTLKVKLTTSDFTGCNLLNNDNLFVLYSSVSSAVDVFNGAVNTGYSYSKATISGTNKTGTDYETAYNNAIIPANSAYNGNLATSGLRSGLKTEQYGMYLTLDPKMTNDSKVLSGCSIEAIFAEINNENFAAVIEAESETKADSKSGDVVLDLLEKVQPIEYNSISKTTGSTGYSPIDEKTGVRQNGTGLKKAKTEWLSDSQLTAYVNSKFSSSALPSDAISSTAKLFWYTITKKYSEGLYFKLTDEVDTNSTLQLMTFTNTSWNASEKWANELVADNTFAVDPNYTNKTTIKTLLDLDHRSAVQYTINKSVYFNFSNETSDVIFASSPDAGSSLSLLDFKRTIFNIDTSEGDIYLFFNTTTTIDSSGKAVDNGSTAQFLFKKCTFQVTGEHNCYILLVGDTSFVSDTFKIDLSTGNDNDTTDEKVGTHFIGNGYQKYKLGFTNNDRIETALVGKSAILAGIGECSIRTWEDGYKVQTGDMYIIGMQENNIRVGRGGYINALVYIPNGSYENDFTGLFGFVPIANSSNNEASVIASNINIGQSNRGQLIFTTYDVSRIGGSGTNKANAEQVFGSLVDNENSPTSSITTWKFSKYEDR